MARGSVKARPMTDGTIRYRIKWETRGPDGKRRYHSATRRTKKEAEAFLAEKLDEVVKGSFVQPAKETLATFLERWIAAVEPRLAEATAYQYRSMIRTRIVPHLGGTPLHRLNALAIQAAYTALDDADYAPNTIVQTHAVLNAALRQAVTWRMLSHNPADGIILPAVHVSAPAVGSADEAAAFLSSAEEESDRHAPLWRFALDTGMRLGEMLALSWRDVAFDASVVRVRRTLTRSGAGGWQLGEHGKTSSSRRSIVIAPATVAAIRRHRAKQAARRLAAGSAWRDLDLVFDRGDGGWFNPSTIEVAFDAAIVRAGVPRLTPHSMRHTMATLLLAAGAHPKIVQERLGHKTITMTLDRYSHVTMTMQHDAAQVLADVMAAAQARVVAGELEVGG